MIADSIINAHVMTMRALESLNSPTGSISHPPGQPYLHSATTSDFPKSASFTTSRHLTLSPVKTASDDADRPAHLPAHLIRVSMGGKLRSTLDWEVRMAMKREMANTTLMPAKGNMYSVLLLVQANTI
jgi:hypothetical protein